MENDRRERRVVAARDYHLSLQCDIEESTGVLRRVGSEAYAAIRVDHRRLLRAAFGAHGGHEIDTAGDGFFVAFDSARDAVQAAVDGQGWPEEAKVRVRMGLPHR